MKPSTAKAKGRETENIFVRWMKTRWGKTVERRRLTGAQDQGDITGWNNVCVEIKSGASIDLPGWLKQLEDEKINSHSEYGFVAVRPKGKPDPEEWYAVVALPDMMNLLMDLELLRPDSDMIRPYP